MKTFWQLLLILSTFAISNGSLCTERSTIIASRENAVRILVPSNNSAGTGFFLDEEHVITAYHVIGQVKVVDETKEPVEVNVTIGKDVLVVLLNGEQIAAQVVAPTETQNPIKLTNPLPSPALSVWIPILNDFAILKLKNKPKSHIISNPLFRGKSLPIIGSDIVFSGYPLDAPTMLTHKGIISGITKDQTLICIEAPINKGNSGGALLNEAGEVIGIITAREGGISRGLDDLIRQISETEKNYSVEFIGVNPLTAIKDLTNTLNRYISPGIGYARTIKNVTDYLDKYPEVLK